MIPRKICEHEKKLALIVDECLKDLTDPNTIFAVIQSPNKDIPITVGNLHAWLKAFQEVRDIEYGAWEEAMGEDL